MNSRDTRLVPAVHDLLMTLRGSVSPEGHSGFFTLNTVKTNYYAPLLSALQTWARDAFGIEGEIEHEMWKQVLAFFQPLVNPAGMMVLPAVIGPIHAGEKPGLAWHAMHTHFVKSDYLLETTTIEVGSESFVFDVSRVHYKENNEHRHFLFTLKDIDEDGKIILDVSSIETSDTIDVESIVQEIQEAGKQVHKRTVTIALNRFRQAPTHDYFLSSDIGSRLKDLFDVTFGKRCMRSMEENGIDMPNTFKIACSISKELIKFVSLLEGMLASLWTAPKHPVRSGYVITFSILESLDEYNMLVEEIANHPGMDTQLTEWRALGIIEENISPNDILLQSLFGMRVKDEYSHLPIDTRHFKNLEPRIISSFDDLESSLDGWLVKGDNFQVLTSMASKFKGRVQMVYIDPPFNKGEDSGYRYSVDYTDSVWLTMLQDRLTVVKDYLENTGNMFVRCDYRGTLGLRYLLDEIFGANQYRNEIAVGRTKGKKQTTTSLPNIKDTLFLYGASKKNRLNEVMIETQEAATVHKVGNFLKRSKTLKELDIASKVDRLADEMLWVPLDHRPGERKSTRDRVLFGRTFPPPPNRHWIKTQDRIQELGKAGKARIRCKCGFVHQDGDGPWKGCPKCSGNNQRIEIYLDEEPLTDVWSDISGYAQTWGFPTENTEGMLRRAILAGSNEGDIVMDFFLGSGTAVATAHKLGRRWIGIEMGKHFHDIILPRMKKVLSGHDSGISADIDARKGGFFKYMEVPPFAAFCDCIFLNRKRLGDVLDSVGAGKEVNMIESLLELKEAGTVEPSPFEDIDALEYITWKEGKWVKCINDDVVELESGETKQVSTVDPLSSLQEFMNR